jgi:hypothetical protein
MLYPADLSTGLFDVHHPPCRPHGQEGACYFADQPLEGKMILTFCI